MGKGGGPLSVWIKEFTSLVFMQTMQAFLYAIIISIILFGMRYSYGIDGDDANAAMGMMSVFALASIFKVEEYAKKIFGMQDTKATPGDAIKSIAKTAIAFKLGQRVLNNGGKVAGGLSNVVKARKERGKLNSRLEEDMQDNGLMKDPQTGKITVNPKTRAGGSIVGTGMPAQGDGFGRI